MIHVSLTTLLLLGMALGIGLLGFIWLVAVWGERRKEGRAREDLVHCRICGHIYENGQRKSVTACPKCGSQNEAIRPKPI